MFLHGKHLSLVKKIFKERKWLVLGVLFLDHPLHKHFFPTIWNISCEMYRAFLVTVSVTTLRHRNVNDTTLLQAIMYPLENKNQFLSKSFISYSLLLYQVHLPRP